MVPSSQVVSYLALQVGVILIASVLWVILHREERRRRLMRSLRSVLADEDVNRSGEKLLKRAA